MTINELFIFTEEPSAKNVFNVILRKMLPKNIEFRIFEHQGKQDLEKALKTTLPTISKRPGSKILITRDQDNEDCLLVKNKINNLIKDSCHCDYYIRIVCRELESWFLGDLEAIKKAYPRFKPENYKGKNKFKNVDKIHSPNKSLLKIIPEYSKRENLPKLETSSQIAPFLEIDKNKSESFNQTILAIKKLLEL